MTHAVKVFLRWHKTTLMLSMFSTSLWQSLLGRFSQPIEQNIAENDHQIVCGLQEMVLMNYGACLLTQCPMLARKFPKGTAQRVAELISECQNQLNIATSTECEQLRRLLHLL